MTENIGMKQKVYRDGIIRRKKFHTGLLIHWSSGIYQV
jgi:hypothetical protein